jgi:hypothetical protein
VEEKYARLQLFCTLLKGPAKCRAAFARRRGRGFESPRLHSKNVAIRRKSVVRQRVSVLTPTMYTHPQREDGILFGGKD